MPLYYVTVEQAKSWRLTIEAKDEVEAQEKAIDELEFVEPDLTFEPEVVDCEEVKRGVNEW